VYKKICNISAITVLSIDDDVNELGVMAILFNSAGYRHLIAEDGETGFARAIFAQPDLILLDVCMAGMDGFETCRKLRQHHRTKHIPILLKTCFYSSEVVLEGLRAGIDDFIVKPCNHTKLLKQIKSQLDQNRNNSIQSMLEALKASAFGCSLSHLDFISSNILIASSL